MLPDFFTMQYIYLHVLVIDDNIVFLFTLHEKSLVSTPTSSCRGGRGGRSDGWSEGERSLWKRRERSRGC